MPLTLENCGIDGEAICIKLTSCWKVWDASQPLSPSDPFKFFKRFESRLACRIMSTTTASSTDFASVNSRREHDVTRESLTADGHALEHNLEQSRSQSPDSILIFSSDEEGWTSVADVAEPDCVVPDSKRSSASMFSAVLKQKGYLEQLLEHADCQNSSGCECEFCFLERGELL